jgi:hypothetical protein
MVISDRKSDLMELARLTRRSSFSLIQRFDPFWEVEREPVGIRTAHSACPPEPVVGAPQSDSTCRVMLCVLYGQVPDMRGRWWTLRGVQQEITATGADLAGARMDAAGR